MKIKRTIALFFCTAVLNISSCLLYAQEVNAALAEFTPEAFPGFPSEGTFLATFGKTSGTVPAGTAQVIFTMVPEVPWNGNPITTPVGWTLALNSTPTNIRFLLTEDWTNVSEQNPQWIVPVTAIAPRSDQSLAVTSQIQQLDGDWTISAPLTRVSITVENNPLPVTLTSFSVSKEGQSALLAWATTEETNSERFDIERSLNGVNWSPIGSVASKGESGVLQQYSFIDSEPTNGENLYRLKMIDRDDNFAYSRIQSVTFEGIQDQCMVFPNPASELINIGVKDLSKIKSLKMYDPSGKMIYSATGKTISRTIDVECFNTGLYIVELAYIAGSIKTSKIVIFR